MRQKALLIIIFATNKSAMKQILFFILALITFSCNISRMDSPQEQISWRLRNLDRQVYQSPGMVLDSVKVISSQSLNERNIAYSKLLMTIAYEYANGTTLTDSARLIPDTYFRVSEDIYNHTRTLLYNGITLFNKDKNDSTAYIMVKDAEKLYLNNHIRDYNLGGTLYLYIGRIHRARANRIEAENNLLKSLEFSQKAANRINLLNARLELFWIYLAQQRYGDALAQSAYFGDEPEIPSYMAYNLYNGLFSYHSAKRDNTIAIEYLKKMVNTAKAAKLNVNYPKLNGIIANFFKRDNNKDSTLHYSKLAVASITDTLETDSHYYYKYLAELYAEDNNYKEALTNYKLAYTTYMKAFTRMSINRVAEIERKYDITSKEAEIKSLKSQRTVLIFIVILITILSLTTIYIIMRLLKKHHNKAVMAVKEKAHYKQDNRRLWITSEILKTTSYVLPQLIDNVYKEALRSRRVSSEIFDSLTSIIEQTNLMTRSSLASITSKEEFSEMYSYHPNLDKLTDYEKLVFILSEDGFSNQEIGDFLNTTQSSIRSLKGRIHKKVFQNEE